MVNERIRGLDEFVESSRLEPNPTRFGSNRSPDSIRCGFGVEKLGIRLRRYSWLAVLNKSGTTWKGEWTWKRERERERERDVVTSLEVSKSRAKVRAIALLPSAAFAFVLSFRKPASGNRMKFSPRAALTPNLIYPQPPFCCVVPARVSATKKER